MDNWTLHNYGTAPGTATVIDAGAGAPTKKALRVAMPAPGETQKWAIALAQPLPRATAAKTLLKLTFWARSNDVPAVAAMVQRIAAPHQGPFYSEFKLTPNWQQFEVSGADDNGLTAGEAQLQFHLAFAAGTVDLADIRVAPVKTGRTTIPTKDAPQTLTENGDFSGNFDNTWLIVNPDAIRREIVKVENQPFQRALKLEVTPAADALPWGVQIGQKFNKFIAQGELVSLRMWMRSDDSVPLTIVAELAEGSYEKFLTRSVKLTPQWKEYRFVALAPRAYQADGAQFKIFLGAAKGSLEIADVRVENYGATPLETFPEEVDYWAGQAHPDTWRAAALARIERVRKGDLRVKVVDANGNPVKGAAVKVEMQRHAFKWGVAIEAQHLVDDDADSVRYREVLKKDFNTIVFGNEMKWPVVASEPQLAPIVERGIGWAQQNGFAIRGHNLVWGSTQYLPRALQTMSDEEARAAVKARAIGYSSQFRGQVFEWDVVNEAVTENDLWNRIGWPTFADTFRWAREGAPNAELAYNDFNIANETPDGGHQRAQVEEKIRYLLDQKAPLDVIGDQAHMNTPLTPIHRVLEIWDEMAKFNKPLEITEFDVAINDDQFHADYVRDFLIAAFSEPQIQGFTQWGFWAKEHWRGPTAALYDADWTPRPALQAYEDLVLKDWWTNVRGATDEQGTYQARGFLGDYQVTVSDGKLSKTVAASLTKTGQNLKITLSE